MDPNTEEGSNTDSSDEEIEYSNLIEEAEMQDCTRYRGKLYKDLTFEDLKEVEFNSIEEVDKFYSYYSLAKGFSVRKYKLDKNRSGTLVIRRQLVCSKQVHGREIKCRFADGGNVKDLLTILWLLQIQVYILSSVFQETGNSSATSTSCRKQALLENM